MGKKSETTSVGPGGGGEGDESSFVTFADNKD